MQINNWRKVSIAIFLAIALALFLLWRSAAFSGTMHVSNDEALGSFSDALGVYLSMVFRNIITPTPTPTEEPVPTTGDIDIVNIVYDGGGSYEADEYVEIKIIDTTATQLEDWTLMDEDLHTYTFPAYQTQPGESCRVYSNIYDPEWCGFS